MISKDFDNSFEIEKLISKDFDKRFIDIIKSRLNDLLLKDKSDLAYLGIKAANDNLDKLWDFYHNKILDFNE